MYAADVTVFHRTQDDAQSFSAALDFALSADEVFDLYNNAPCGYHSLDERGTFLRINNTELKWLGYTRDEIVGRMRFADLLTEASRETVDSQFAGFRMNGCVRDLEFELVRKDGNVLSVLLNATAVFNDRGDVAISRASVFDITERKKAEVLLRDRERFIDRILAATPDLIYVHDTIACRYVFANREAGMLLGYTPEEIASMGELLFERLINPEDLPKVAAHLARVLASPDDTIWQTEYRLRRADGVYRTFHFRDCVFERDRATGAVTRYLGVAQDVTERRFVERLVDEQSHNIREFAIRMSVQRDQLEQANRRLEALATADGLTGLLNHRAFQDRLRNEVGRAQSESKPLTLMMLDIDDFKAYNDTFGHPAGDDVIKSVAHELREGIRPTDSAARYGGEEFAIILPGTDAETGMMIAERLRRRVETMSHLFRRTTTSIGAATLCSAETSAAALLSDADAALYLAKRNGRNCVRHRSIAS